MFENENILYQYFEAFNISSEELLGKNICDNSGIIFLISP